MKTEQFFQFIYDRQLIWHKRFILNMPAPWTDDEILKTYKFCNVYRELDFGTLHLIKNVINAPMYPEDKIFNIILFRRFNVRTFFDEIYLPKAWQAFDLNTLEKEFDLLKSSGVKLFNEAYTICQVPFDENYRKEDKHIQILLSMNHIAPFMPQITKKLKDSKSLEECFNILKSIKLIGPFLAYQILQDIQYIPGFLKHDINSFVSIGPGALGGLKLLGLNGKPEIECDFLFQHQYNYSWFDIYYKGAYFKSPCLSMGNIQASLCEFRKFIMLKTNPKARKRYYKGET